MNQTLEEMARAIFQDWFVDFGPVRAKLEGREPYLPPELWGLFPAAGRAAGGLGVGGDTGGVGGWRSQRFNRNLERGNSPYLGISVLEWGHSLVHREGCSRLE